MVLGQLPFQFVFSLPVPLCVLCTSQMELFIVLLKHQDFWVVLLTHSVAVSQKTISALLNQISNVYNLSKLQLKYSMEVNKYLTSSNTLFLTTELVY